MKSAERGAEMILEVPFRVFQPSQSYLAAHVLSLEFFDFRKKISR